MRIKLQFEIINKELPQSYRRPVISFFKNAVEQYEGEKFRQMYDKGLCKSKSYSFAAAFPKGTTFVDKLVNLPDPRFSITFSTGDLQELIVFYNAFLAQKNKSFPLPEGNSMTLREISYVNVPPIVKDQVMIQMLSPIVVRVHDREQNHDKYLTYQDPEFSQAFLENTKLQLRNLGQCQDAGQLEIHPIKAKTVLIREFGAQYVGNLGTYVLRGEPQVLNILQMSGIGSRRNAGSGLFTVIG